MKVKIYYHHTDSGGVVYYANYLKFLEEARTEYLEQNAISVKELADRGILFVVARQEIDYKNPAFYGDTLSINTLLTEISGVKLVFECEILNQDNKIVSIAKTIMVCIGKDFKPQAIPEEIRKKLSNQ
ncbi:MAG: thioesterase family protein [Candidatus Omnitrophica bacterium]|nr:thioesterase family protein [Candidatus Omnitrophota bacterium]